MNYSKSDLYLAIKNKNYSKCLDILKWFDVRQNEFVDENASQSISFLTWAVLNGSPSIVQALIQHGADVNRLSFLNYGWPTETKIFNSFECSLITATRHKNYKICEILLKNKAKINKIDSFQMSALHWSSSLNLVDIVRLLLDYNANPNIMDLKNQTALEKAIYANHVEIVELFAQKTSLDEKFREYLMASIRSSNIRIFKILLNQIENGKVKFDLNLIDDSIGSILHHAVIINNLNKSLAADQSSNATNKEKKSNVEIIKLWVDKDGVEINIKNRLGETPLHMTKDVDVSRLLINKGAAMNYIDATGKMPLFAFILRDNFDICIEMLKNGCDLENIDRLGNSLLYAILNSNAPIKLILLLIEAGIELNKNEWKGKNCRLLQKYPKLAKTIEYRLRNPPSLKELARKSLRSHLNKINQAKSIVNSVNKLEKLLPSSLQDYILLNLSKFETILIK